MQTHSIIHTGKSCRPELAKTGILPETHYRVDPQPGGKFLLTPVERVEEWREKVPESTPTPVDQVAEMAAKLEPERVCGNCRKYNKAKKYSCTAFLFNPEPTSSCRHHQPREEG